jgi:hypothetical protein
MVTGWVKQRTAASVMIRMVLPFKGAGNPGEKHSSQAIERSHTGGVRPFYPKRLKALWGKNRRPREAKDYAGTWILKPGTWNALKVAETRKALQAPWSGA